MKLAEFKFSIRFGSMSMLRFMVAVHANVRHEWAEIFAWQRDCGYIKLRSQSFILTSSWA